MVASVCRLKVISKFRKQFICPLDAERHFWGIDVVAESEDSSPSLEEVTEYIGKIGIDQQLKVISVVFQKLAGSTYGVDIDGDFLELALQASKHLQECGRSNVLCGLARAIGTLHLDGSDSRLPAKRMPMGLLEYRANFFNSDSYRDPKVYVSLQFASCFTD